MRPGAKGAQRADQGARRGRLRVSARAIDAGTLRPAGAYPESGDNTRRMSSGAFFRRPAVLLIAALCLLAAVMTILGRLAGGPGAETKPRALPQDIGAEATPAFSPDGRRLAYSARGLSKGESFHVFVRSLPDGVPRQLTEGGANDISPAWSPDGCQHRVPAFGGRRAGSAC